MQEIEIDRHDCCDDSGNTYTVVEYQEIRPAPTLAEPHATVMGLKRLALLGGGAVNFVNATTFKVVRNDKTIRKV